MHTSWGSNPICFLNISCVQLVFDPDDVSLWKTNISRLGTCAIMRSVEGLVYSLMAFSSIGSLLSFGIFSKWYLQSCVDLGFWYNLDNSFSCHTCVLCWFNWYFVQIVSHLVIESLVHAYLLYVYLMACLLFLIQYIG